MEMIYYTAGCHYGSEKPYFVRWLTPDGLLHEEKQTTFPPYQAFLEAVLIMPDWKMIGPVEFNDRARKG